MKTALILLCLPLTAAAQSFSTGSGNIVFDNVNEITVLTPPPVQVGEDLEMATLPVRATPLLFHLHTAADRRYGPYPLAHDTPVGDERAPHILRMFDVGRHFTLHASSDTNTLYGPFPATNGAVIALERGSLTFHPVQPEFTVSLNHAGKINQRPLIGIAPWTPELERELHSLRGQYMTLIDRVDMDTSSAVFQGTPRVHSRRSGNTVVSPVISVSQRDKQNALKGAELTAIRYLETLFGKFFRIRSQAFTDGDTYHFAMPPGDYIFCAMQKTKDPEAKGPSQSLTAIWWTAFAFDGERPLALPLTTDNAITWRDVFTFTR